MGLIGYIGVTGYQSYQLEFLCDSTQWWSLGCTRLDSAEIENLLRWSIYSTLPNKNSTATTILMIGQIFIGTMDVRAPVARPTPPMTKSRMEDAM